MRDIINVVEKIVLDLREVDEGASLRGREVLGRDERFWK